MYGTGGKVNRMSDDLISRKALLEELREIMDEPHNTMFLMGIGAAVSIVEHRETAFDKERVIGELVELRQIEYNDSDEEPELLDGEEIYDEGRSQGRFEAYHRAIEIVEKGGIE